MNFFGNITQRRNRKVSETKSEDSNSNITDSELDGTTSNSLPNISDDDDCDTIVELKNKIKDLTSQLEAAHKEVDNLNIDNSNLKQTIENLTKREHIYKKLTTDIIVHSPKKKPTKIVPIIDLCITPKTKENRERVTSHNIVEKTPKTPKPALQNCKTSTFTATKPMSQMLDKSTQCEIHGNNFSVLEKLFDKTQLTQYTKTKLCVISANNRNRLCNVIEDFFETRHEFCHYSYPNGDIEELLFGIENKLKNYNKSDYCVILIGEKDFTSTKNYHDLIHHIKDTTDKLSHTNIIICLPTFRICGEHTTLYNSRIEMFNNLLYMHSTAYKYAYLLDSNADLSFDSSMFSGRQGLLNDAGIKNIFMNLKRTISEIQMINNDIELKDISEETSNQFFLQLSDH